MIQLEKKIEIFADENLSYAFWRFKKCKMFDSVKVMVGLRIIQCTHGRAIINEVPSLFK